MKLFSSALAVVAVACVAVFAGTASAATTTFCVGGSTVNVGDQATITLLNNEIANGGIVDVLTATSTPNINPFTKQPNPQYEQETIYPDTQHWAAGYQGLPDAGYYTYTDESVSAGACGSGGASATTAAAAVPRPPDSMFLCYSALQDNPGVWSDSEATALHAQGYWSPYAVKGNVAGGTNIGGYHLSCNVKAAQGVSSTFVDGGGNSVGSALANAVGYYPVVG